MDAALDGPALGERPEDIVYDWGNYARSLGEKYSTPSFEEYFARFCHFVIKTKRSLNDDDYAPINVFDLNEQQKVVFDLLKAHMQSTELNPEGTPPIRLIVQGSAGTGKSFLIRALQQLLNRHDAPRGYVLPTCILLAPTGVAAVNIGGATIQSALRLYNSNKTPPLILEPHAVWYREKFSRVRYVLIDERSMMGCRLLACVDQRLREISSPLSTHPFGGLSVILFGDHYQLPPVQDHELHALPQMGSTSYAESMKGHVLYRTFDQAIVLTLNQRQAGEDPASQNFRLVLDRLRKGTSVIEDWDMLMTRRLEFLPRDEKTKFDNAVRVYAQNDYVDLYNWKSLVDLGAPVALVKAENNNSDARIAGAAEAGGLRDEILLSPGCRVMLTSNLATHHGLVNGAVGTVINIVYGIGVEPPALPIAVLVKFDEYNGPSVLDDQDGVVPIMPKIMEWRNKKRQECTRRQIPLTVAYAVTVHKAQGSTMTKAVVDIGHRDFASGLSFVALSRTRRLTDLALSTGFPFSRLPQDSATRALGFHWKKLEEKRLAQLGTLNPTA